MTPTIVVGVDGSPGSDAALQWAVDEARLRGADLHVIHAWSYPYLADLSYLAAASIDRGLLETAAKELLMASVARVLGDARDVVVHESVVEGSPATVLAEAAVDADLLVVSTRGRSRSSEFLLGSVSHHVTHHAPCPVVIVPAPQP